MYRRMVPPLRTKHSRFGLLLVSVVVAVCLVADESRHSDPAAFLPPPCADVRWSLVSTSTSYDAVRSTETLGNKCRAPTPSDEYERRSRAALAAPLLLGLALGLLRSLPANAAGVAAVASSSVDFAAVWSKAAASAFKGGVAGLIAGVAQVLSFMWLRTSMNYQYANGGNLQASLSTLWKEGGLARLYQGVSLALVQAPLSRFGDTAANAGVLVLMDAFFPDVPLPVKTAAASTAAALWRLFLTPIDTLKTARQVHGEKGVEIIMERVKQRGPTELYAGALATFAANWVGNFPYFTVFNTLSDAWLTPAEPVWRIVRNGVLGMCSSIASDICSNSLRVLKTLRQSSSDPNKNYLESAQEVLDKEGFVGLFGRGLETRLLVNILQGTFFAIVWKLAEEWLGVGK
eukprot:TRINITY_DN65744_c0_g2_i1.p1 TRINITY_DN65744_c0_g2~~TRINITY_DN65744_c0_g2_i1.p1  ORF type:complete len:403 (-),score=62.34 TRINITY_DN65744_c0_g2_i1:118-1326(-)